MAALCNVLRCPECGGKVARQRPDIEALRDLTQKELAQIYCEGPVKGVMAEDAGNNGAYQQRQADFLHDPTRFRGGVGDQSSQASIPVVASHSCAVAISIL